MHPYKHQVTSREVMNDIARALKESQKATGEHISHGAALNSAARFFGWQDWNTFVAATKEQDDISRREAAKEADLRALLQEAGNADGFRGDDLADTAEYLGKAKPDWHGTPIGPVHAFRDVYSRKEFALTLWPLQIVFGEHWIEGDMVDFLGEKRLLAYIKRKDAHVHDVSEHPAFTRMRVALRPMLAWDGGASDGPAWDIEHVEAWLANEVNAKKALDVTQLVEDLKGKGLSAEGVLFHALMRMEFRAMLPLIRGTPSYSALLEELSGKKEEEQSSERIHALEKRCAAQAPAWVKARLRHACSVDRATLVWELAKQDVYWKERWPGWRPEIDLNCYGLRFTHS